MEIKSQPVQNFIGFMNALELYESQRDGWALGARDSLLFMRAILFPLDTEIEGFNAPRKRGEETVKALHALDKERSERFKQKVIKFLEQDEMTKKMCSDLFDMLPANEEVEPEQALLIDLCYHLEWYLQRRRNFWVIGALDALRWLKVTLYPFPFNEHPKIDPKTAKAVTEVYKEWQEQFENELRKRFGNDEMQSKDMQRTVHREKLTFKTP